MKLCQFALIDTHWVCVYCGDKYKNRRGVSPHPPLCKSDPQNAIQIVANIGPGDYLHDAILKWVGEGPTRECGCKDRINKMNAWGPVGCREHLEEIVEWMMGEAQKRGWWVAVIVPILPRIFIRKMVLGAIAEAEKATATQSSDS